MSIFLSFFAVTAMAQTAGRTEVPFRLAEDAIVVDAKVNNRDVALMFDTGFGGTVIVGTGIDVGEPSGTMTLRDFVGEMEAKTVTLKSLKLGNKSMSPDEKIIVQQPGNLSLSYGQHVDGIMGLSVIKNQTTEINFERSRFIFHPDTEDISARVPDNKRTFLLKMLPIGGNSIELSVATESGERMTLALDTGNAFYATTHKDVLERVGIWKGDRKPSFTRFSGVASGAVESWSMKMPPLKIFGVPVKPTVWDIIDLPSSSAEGDGTVGFGFLKNFNVTVDYKRRRVWLEKWHDPVENEIIGDVGISAGYDKEHRRTVVALVAPKSPAEEAGIKEGDLVLGVGSVDIVNQGFRQMRKLLEGPVDSEVNLALSRGGQLRRVKLRRRALINE